MYLNKKAKAKATGYKNKMKYMCIHEKQNQDIEIIKNARVQVRKAVPFEKCSSQICTNHAI